MKIQIYGEAENRYQCIIDEMKAKIRRGFRPRRPRESQAVYEVQSQSFYRCCMGMIFMCQVELGQRDVKLTKGTKQLLN